MEDRSTILIVDDANKLQVNRCLARIFGDPAPPASENLSIPLSADGQFPATHWSNHIWRTEEAAATLLALPTNGGTLPPFDDGLTWEDNFSTTEAAVLSAIAAPNLTTYVATGGVPTEHMDGVLAGRDLMLIQLGD